MREKLSQKELLNEGFLDTIRKIASPIAKGIAGVGGLAKGIAKVAAPNLSQAIGSDIDKIKSIGKSASDAFTAEKNRQINSTPERFVENELKTNYSSTFDPKSIKIIEVKQDTTVSLDVSKGVNPKKTKNNRFFVYFQASQYDKTTGNATQQIGGVKKIKGVVTVIKGSNGQYSIVELKDENGQSINQGAQQTIPNLNDLMNKLNFNINNSTAGKWAVALKRSFRNALPDPRKDIDKLIPAAVNDDNYVLTSADVTILRQYLKDEMLISEKNTQKDLLVQLKLLNDSYNKTYELSKH
jgi:hypothetical protein